MNELKPCVKCANLKGQITRLKKKIALLKNEAEEKERERLNDLPLCGPGSIDE